jgi:iron(III) transport system permease protein
MIPIVALASFLLLVLTALPVVVLLVTSVRPEGILWLEAGGFTLGNFGALAGQPGIGPLLWNTAVYVVATIGMSLLFACFWAWVTERTDFRFKVTVRILMLLTMSLPALVQGLGWILLLNPSNGYFNHLLRALPGVSTMDGPINIYSLGMMVVVSSFILTPTVYVMLSGAVKNLDYMLEFPAVLAGVPSRKVMTRIIAPVLLPALLSVVIFTVMIMLQVFDIPLSIGLTAGIHILSTRIYLLSTAELGTPNYNLAAAFGVLLVVVAVVLVALYLRLTRLSEKFSVVSGKNFRYAPVRLGGRRHAIHALACAYFLVSLSPILILLWTSFQPFYSLPSMAGLKTASLQNYASMFGSSMFRRAVGNTAIVIIVGATATMAISLVVAYATVRSGCGANWSTSWLSCPSRFPTSCWAWPCCCSTCARRFTAALRPSSWRR